MGRHYTLKKTSGFVKWQKNSKNYSTAFVAMGADVDKTVVAVEVKVTDCLANIICHLQLQII